MADYKDKLDEWQKAARRKARELDEKFGIKDRVEDGARAAQDAARRGAETFATGAEHVRAEAERLGEEYEVRERARHAAEEAALGPEPSRLSFRARARGSARRDASLGACREPLRGLSTGRRRASTRSLKISPQRPG